MSECVIATSTQVKAPRLMLAKMESEEMEMTAEEIKRRDAETKWCDSFAFSPSFDSP